MEFDRKWHFHWLLRFLYTHEKKNLAESMRYEKKKSSANSETSVDIVWWRRLIWIHGIFFIQYNTNSGKYVDVANLVRSSSIGLQCRISNHRFMNMLNIFVCLDWTICIYRKTLYQHHRFEYIGIWWKWHPNESKVFTQHTIQSRCSKKTSVHITAYGCFIN